MQKGTRELDPRTRPTPEGTPPDAEGRFGPIDVRFAAAGLASGLTKCMKFFAHGGENLAQWPH